MLVEHDQSDPQDPTHPEPSADTTTAPEHSLGPGQCKTPQTHITALHWAGKVTNLTTQFSSRYGD